MEIIGREREIEELVRLRDSSTSEFVMVYGRRRVGKTYLIREFFEDKFDFYLTGIAHGSRVEQLMNFGMTIKQYVRNGDPLKPPTNWYEAFEQLKSLTSKSKNKRKIIFLDELPWMVTQKSEFVKALELFWNSWASARTDVLLIVCGSASSWMVKNIVKNHGGLHNRITFKIKLKPFTLQETKLYLESRHIEWSEQMIAECYMILGGIPYYLKMLNGKYSLAQNVDQLFFNESALLEDEFENLYASLFRNSADYIRIVEALAEKKVGFSRDEILKKTKMLDGGSFSRKLEELEQCGFIRKYLSAGGVRQVYQLVDFYSLFYETFIKRGPHFDTDRWMNIIDTPLYNTWLGLSFERLCLAHLPQIKQKLGISGVSTNTYSLHHKEAQVDMVIERGDNIVNLCEMKFSDDPYEIDKKYADSLRNKRSVLRGIIKKKQSVSIVMITANGLKRNQYSAELVQNEVSLSDLFKGNH